MNPGDTLGAFFAEAAGRWPDNDALVFPDGRQTYQALYSAARQRARSLAALGVAPGEHVGILMPNCPEYMELLLGTVLLGAVAAKKKPRASRGAVAWAMTSWPRKAQATAKTEQQRSGKAGDIRSAAGQGRLMM